MPSEAADELLARMVEYHRYRGAAAHLRERLEAEHGHRYRSAPLPPELRRVALETAEPAYDPERLAEALGDLLRIPPPLDLRPRAPARRCRWSSACATCATCSERAGASPSTTRCAGPTA